MEDTRLKTISIANQKGGVGKSTTALLLGEGLALSGYRVLLVDLDSQGNLTDSLGAAVSYGVQALFDAPDRLRGEIVHTPRVDLLPANPFVVCDTTEPDPCAIREALKQVGADYDYCIIDTAPGLGNILLNALTASDSVIIPILAEPYALAGLSQLYSTINAIQNDTNKALEILGLLLTKYNPRVSLNKQVATLLETCAEPQYKTRLYETHIREGVAVREAQAKRVSLYQYAPRSNVALDYMNFIKEFLTYEQRI